MSDVTADNLILDEAINGLPADAAADNTAEENTCNNKGSSKRKSTGTAPVNEKRSIHSADNEIDVNMCCVCFGMHGDGAGTGREWLECQCSRWIHEDCINNDNVGTEQCIFVCFVKTLIILKMHVAKCCKKLMHKNYMKLWHGLY